MASNQEQLNKIKDIYGKPKTITVGSEEDGEFDLEVHPLSDDDIKVFMDEKAAQDPDKFVIVMQEVTAKLLDVSVEEAKEIPLKIKMDLWAYLNSEYAMSTQGTKAQKAISRFKK